MFHGFDAIPFSMERINQSIKESLCFFFRNDTIS